MDPNFNVLLGDQTEQGACAVHMKGKKQSTKWWVIVVCVVAGLAVLIALLVVFAPRYEKERKRSRGKEGEEKRMREENWGTFVCVVAKLAVLIALLYVLVHRGMKSRR